MSEIEPMVVGVLAELDGGGAAIVNVARRAVDEAAAAGRLNRPVEFVLETVNGLPRGTAAAVEQGFANLEAKGVLFVLGPAITDNALLICDLADQAKLACLNWAGNDQARSEWMFHYQIGSLEEEPYLLARYLATRGIRRIALVQDRSPIGDRLAAFFDAASDREGIELTVRVLVSTVAEDVSAVVPVMRRAEPEAVVYLGLGDAARALGLALATTDWRPEVVAGSALMFGYANPEWRHDWEGWTYADAWSEDNPVLAELRASEFGGESEEPPILLAGGYDMGRLLAEALAGARPLSRRGVKEALERVKCLPAALGTPDTTMSFGHWDRAALKGGFLVLRRWHNGASVRAEVQRR
jgi:ABC-type branched-subunit amino acid transport system substrate-binding protein